MKAVATIAAPAQMSWTDRMALMMTAWTLTSRYQDHFTVTQWFHVVHAAIVAALMAAVVVAMVAIDEEENTEAKQKRFVMTVKKHSSSA